MRVKMITLAADPDGVLLAGQEYDLPAERAVPLVDGGYAESLDPAVDPKVPPSPVLAATEGEDAPPSDPASTGEGGAQ